MWNEGGVSNKERTKEGDRKSVRLPCGGRFVTFVSRGVVRERETRVGEEETQ
jgi:hypothetical protein